MRVIRDTWHAKSRAARGQCGSLRTPFNPWLLRAARPGKTSCFAKGHLTTRVVDAGFPVAFVFLYGEDVVDDADRGLFPGPL
jgi:hypothetical protein